MNFNLSARSNLTRVFATTAAGLGILALAACGQTSNAASDSGPGAKPAAQTQGHQQAKGANDSNVTNPGTSSTRECQTSDLSLHLLTYDVGQGYNLQRLRFTNSSGSTCTLYGYPGVSYSAGEDGGQVGKPAYRKDVGSGFPRVTLRPGGHAYSFINQPDASTVLDSKCQPTDVSGLRIFPPNNTDATYVANEGKACASGAARMSVGPVTSDPNAIP